MLRTVCASWCALSARRGPRPKLRAEHSSTSTSQPSAHPTAPEAEHNNKCTVVVTPSPPPPPPSLDSLVTSSPPPPNEPPPPRRVWSSGAAIAVAAITASLGGVYIWNKKQSEAPSPVIDSETVLPIETPVEPEPAIVPSVGAAFPPQVDYLVAGAGTAAFAALRSLRALRPTATVLLVGEERALPYMRPPLSKEIWREPDLASADRTGLDSLTFRQWNGRRRPVAYEPEPFYTPIEELAACGGGAAVARGWTVTRIDIASKSAVLEAPGHEPVTVAYEGCLLATGSVPKRVPALAAAADKGRSFALRSLRDAVHIAKAIEEPQVKTVAVIGGGFLACELSAALAERLQGAGEGKRVVMVTADEAPMAGVLPAYLQQEAVARLQVAGVTIVRGATVSQAALTSSDRITMTLTNGKTLEADIAVEAVGAEASEALPVSSGLEWHPALGGVVVNAELQARWGVWAAGDVACYHDPLLGRRRVEHHDHAVLSGRRAAENMAAVATGQLPKTYDHQSMFWSDLGPQLGYEAIGLIDATLPTVGVFSTDAVTTEAQAVTSESHDHEAPAAPSEPSAGPEGRRYARGVVFYMRDSRVVGVLLWNLFNRMHIARQVLARGEFDDMLEVGKLFSPHEEE